MFRNAWTFLGCATGVFRRARKTASRGRCAPEMPLGIANAGRQSRGATLFTGRGSVTRCNGHMAGRLNYFRSAFCLAKFLRLVFDTAALRDGIVGVGFAKQRALREVISKSRLQPDRWWWKTERSSGILVSGVVQAQPIVGHACCHCIFVFAVFFCRRKYSITPPVD